MVQWGRMRECMTDVVLTFDGAAGMVHADGVRRPGRASFSMLDGWRSCPGRWLADRMLPRPVEWDSPLVVGSIAHAALELAMREPDKPDPDWNVLCRRGVRLLAERNRRRGWGDDPTPEVVMPDGGVASGDDWADAAAKRLDCFRLTDALGRAPSPLACEEHVDGTVWGIPFTGSVDYVDGSQELGVTLVDWKTGRAPERADAKMRHADQLRLYALLWSHAHGFMPSGACDVYVEHRRMVGVDLSGEMIRGTGDWMRTVWDEVRSVTGVDGSGAFPLRPSPLCGWCPLARVCPNATVRGMKAREAMRSAWPADDPRFRVVGTHTQGVNVDDGRMVMSLLSMLDSTPSESEAEKPETVKTETGVDPWATREGEEALTRWGVTGSDTPRTDTVTEESSSDVADMPADKREETPVADAASPRTDTGVVLFEGRPYEGTWREGGLNAAGYGFSLLNTIAVRAMRLSSGREDWLDSTVDALLYATWGVARTVWGSAVPDLSGLRDGVVDSHQLYAWLDTMLCRDAWRALDAMLDMDVTVADAADAKELSRIVAAAGRLAARSLAVTRRFQGKETK